MKYTTHKSVLGKTYQVKLINGKYCLSELSGDNTYLLTQAKDDSDDSFRNLMAMAKANIQMDLSLTR